MTYVALYKFIIKNWSSSRAIKTECYRVDEYQQVFVLVWLGLFCPGSLGELIVERGRLPEDLSLYYHSQVLTALEYLRKKKVVHLDIKGTL